MKLREMGSLCLAPVILAGYLSTVEWQTSVSHRTYESTGQGAIVQIQSCERGFGVDFKASTNGLYGFDLQYGLQFNPYDKFTVTFTPRFGASYTDHPVRELPQGAQFGLGGAITLGYDRFRTGFEFWHLSNGAALGLNVSDGVNVGLNLISMTAGWSF